MAISEDLINFDLIETHKENIQQLPGGRSARQLVSVLSPLASTRSGTSPTLDETKTLNDAIRQEYELELQSIADSDDPLDIYDRYVKWTLNAYPSAQATPQSQLLPLLERATKAFLTSSHYKNDPRYLKLWLHYIRLFSDAPRETFAYLARHSIGEGLGLFYEEFAAWLENAGRWSQADEVYKLGIEREARPAERLMRKYNHFQQRHAAEPHNANEPSSPALPTVRPALAAKVDPFSTTPRSEDQQTSRPRPAAGSATSARSGKPKMAIFADADDATPPAATSATNGWDSIGSIKDRKKENTIEARPWTGEVLKAGKKVGTVPKMEIFKDPTLRNNESNSKQSSKQLADVVNPRTGRAERVFVNLDAVYPNAREEYSFEELRARRRGWMDRSWRKKEPDPLQQVSENVQRSPAREKVRQGADVENFSQDFQSKASIDDGSSQPSDSQQMKPTKQKRIKVREVKQETQTVKTRLESPTGPKMRRKNSSEPTMTFHSKAATDEIYNIFNQPLKQDHDDTQSGDDTDFGDDMDNDGYSTAGESTGTGRISGTTSEFGDVEDTMSSMNAEQRHSQHTGSQPDSVSPWSDFTASKHVPRLNKSKHKARQTESGDFSDNITSSLNQTQTGGFDTQAIAAIANQDFGEMDTVAIARLAGDDEDEDEDEDGDEEENENEEEEEQTPNEDESENDLKTPISPQAQIEFRDKPRYVPLPPEDYEPTPLRPFRDPMVIAQNRLPFMTPIVEKTESSLAPSTMYAEKDYFVSKTPSRSKFESPSKLQIDALLLSSPQREIESPPSAKRKLLLANGINKDLESSTLSLPKNSLPSPVKESFKIPFSVTKPIHSTAPSTTEPIITDLQCNPCDDTIRTTILSHPSILTSLTSEPGYHDNIPTKFGHYATLAAYTKQVANAKLKASPRKQQNEKTVTRAEPPILNFEGTSRVYAVKKLLGKGAFAPVYLVESYDADCIRDVEEDATQSTSSSTTSSMTRTKRDGQEAIKTDHPPLNGKWEFYILRNLSSRLSSSSNPVSQRALESILQAHECHVFADEAYLVLDFHPQGTLLDLVNAWKEDAQRSGKSREGEGVDEAVAAWLGVELLRTLVSVHAAGILHGDLKADNCLVRMRNGPPASDLGAYAPDGSAGWATKGLTLIDFGRGIDMRAFRPAASFVADWKTERTDAVELREGRPWRTQIDAFGAAGVLHSCLFGKYIDTVPATAAVLGRKTEWRLKEGFKRYWKGAMWADVFGVLVNSGVVLADKGEAAVCEEMERVRRVLELWLVEEGEREGRSLRAGLRRVEALLAARK